MTHKDFSSLKRKKQLIFCYNNLGIQDCAQSTAFVKLPSHPRSGDIFCWCTLCVSSEKVYFLTPWQCSTTNLHFLFTSGGIGATSTLKRDFFAQKVCGSGLPRRNRQPSTKSFAVVTTDGRNTGLIIMLKVSNEHVKLAMMNIDEYQ